jgi:hypothetical protein
MRDYQQSKVYNWEAKHVTPGGRIEFNQAQAIVDHVWKEEGLYFPPRVKPIDCRTTKWAGKADRLRIILQPSVTMQTLLHELAHSMTARISGESNMHGPQFVGVYTKLIEKYLGMSLPVLLYTQQKEGVDCDIMASPIFLDE